MNSGSHRTHWVLAWGREECFAMFVFGPMWFLPQTATSTPHEGFTAQQRHFVLKLAHRLLLLLGLQLCCCVLYIRTFSSSLYLWLLGALSVLFWYSFSLHLCLCYSFVYRRKKEKKKENGKKWICLAWTDESCSEAAFYKMECQVLGCSNPASLFIFGCLWWILNASRNFRSSQAWALSITDIVLQSISCGSFCWWTCCATADFSVFPMRQTNGIAMLLRSYLKRTQSFTNILVVACFALDRVDCVSR